MLATQKSKAVRIILIIFTLFIILSITSFSFISYAENDTSSQIVYEASSYIPVSSYQNNSSKVSYLTSSYTPVSSYQEYVSSRYYVSSQYYEGTSSKYYNNYNQYSVSSYAYSSKAYTSSYSAGGAISLLPETSSKDQGEINSQDWNALLGIINSDVSSGVFTFNEDVSSSAGGDWIFWGGTSLIALGVIGIIFIVYFQFFSPRSPGRMKKVYAKSAMSMRQANKPVKKKSYNVSDNYNNAYSSAQKQVQRRNMPSSNKNTSEYGDSFSNKPFSESSITNNTIKNKEFWNNYFNK